MILTLKVFKFLLKTKVNVLYMKIFLSSMAGDI